MRERPAGPSSKPELLPPLFEIVATEEGDHVVIRLRGELDLFERPKLETAIGLAEASEAGRILLDLDELTFIDAAGLNSLVTAGDRSIGNGNRLRMTRGRGSVASMLRLTGLDLALPFEAAEQIAS
jgi:anti-sigma B factor antagonist